MTDLFSPIKIGNLALSNRIVMAPMTRNRAPQNIPTELMAEYYAQRASAGLIITEASQISSQGVGYPATPGIHAAEQVNGWKRITRAVHDKSGRIFLQLWHVGRISHPDYHGGELPVAPSAIKPAGQAFTYEGLKDFITPRALETGEISGIVDQYRHAASCAKEAGFDGVEIHAANGYLIDQFLRDGTNRRTDAYGGSLENRTRFLMEVTGAVIAVWDADRVGIRLSPAGAFNDMHDSDPQTTFNHAAASLSTLHPAYLHVVEVTMTNEASTACDMRQIRDRFNGLYIANGGYDKARGNAAIAGGAADLVAFGVPFLANPDLPERFSRNAQLNEADQTTFYGGDEHGYTDYPVLEAT